MTEKTEGVVLNYIRYRDTSIIVRVFTKKYGLQSYIINGIRSKNSKKSIGLFQPFTILDLVTYHSQKKNINRLSEYKNHFPLSSIHYDIRKSTIALFLTEILVKTLSEEHEEDNLQFDFIKTSILEFDQLTSGHENFHLYFLINYANYLGFGIHDLEGIDETGDDKLLIYLREVKKKSLYPTVQTHQSIRRKALEMILNFFSLHIIQFGKVKSLEVLYQVFDE